MSLRFETAKVTNDTLKSIAASGRGKEANAARDEIRRRTHAELLRLVRCN